MNSTKFRGQEHELIMQIANNDILANIVLGRDVFETVCSDAVECMNFFNKVKRNCTMKSLKYPPFICFNGMIKISTFESGLCVVTIATYVADLTIIAMEPCKMFKLLEGVTQVKKVYCIDEYMAFYAEFVMNYLKKELKRSRRIDTEVNMFDIIGKKR